MPYAGNAPSALEVTFGNDPTLNRPPPKRPTVAYVPTITQQNASKRKEPAPAKRKSVEAAKSQQPAAKKQRVQPGAEFKTPYFAKHASQKETADLTLTGEDRDGTGDNNEKPQRCLTDFAFYDAESLSGTKVLVPMHLLPVTGDAPQTRYQASGFARPVQDAEEQGQEDGNVAIQPNDVYIDLQAVIGYHVDYLSIGVDVILETKHATYMLQAPSSQYDDIWRPFITELYTVQMIMHWALNPNNALASRAAFEADYINHQDPYDKKFEKAILARERAAEELARAVQASEDFQALRSKPLIRAILGPQRLKDLSPTPFLRKPPTSRKSKNPDISLLQPDNQIRTHLTTGIAHLARGWYKERLKVVGPTPPPQHLNDLEELCRLQAFIREANRRDKTILFNPRPRAPETLSDRVNLNNVQYKAGDVVLVRPCDTHLAKFPSSSDKVARGTTLPDFAWFGRIIWISTQQSVHVQWLQHGSLTILGEFAPPKSLYLTDKCDLVSLHDVSGKVTVRFPIPNSVGEYDCRFKYDSSLATFSSVAAGDLDYPAHALRDRCPSCNLQAEKEHEDAIIEEHPGTKDRSGVSYHVGFTYKGTKYHLDDFVLYSNSENPKGPALIGQISRCTPTRGLGWDVQVKLLGRSVDIKNVPADEMRDERELFMTEETAVIQPYRLQGVIIVCHYEHPSTDDELWLSPAFPRHFIVKYSFPTLNAYWLDRDDPVDVGEVIVCAECTDAESEEYERAKHMRATMAPLPTLDLFAGIGAFGGGMADGSGILKVEHAVELSPSAAKTHKKNFVQTTVHNQCVNVILKYWHDYWNSDPDDRPTPPKQLWSEGDEEAPDLPTPPEKDEIKVIVAGFPCQSHSTLNMYKYESDKKSNLILPTLSFIELLQPDYVFFENVPGFLTYKLNTMQESPYKVKGGLEMGGLKLVLRALLDMDYQVRFAVLQAAHYGTPQRRERFFLVAAKRGCRLPDLPQPTHNYPESHELAIKNIRGVLGSDDVIKPIRTTTGIAPFNFVNVRDSLSDLPEFDYKYPEGRRKTENYRAKRRERDALGFKTLPCDDVEACGYTQRRRYKHEALTRFQIEARRNSSQRGVKQQYTRPYQAITVEMILAVPMEAGADYRNFGQNFQRYLMANPVSANAKAGFKPGMFGRIDEKGVFQTTVTNVGPTAKQSYVLHPWCQRMVTVRELARSQGLPDWFRFECIEEFDNFTTRHRQIGNAVPWQVAQALGRELQVALLKDWGDDDDIYA